MDHSENIEKLAAALAVAQGQLHTVKEGSSNDAFKNATYANLEQCWTACRPILSKNGLSVVQGIGRVHDVGGVNFQQVTTMLLHTSGQWISSTAEMMIGRPNAHGQGSAITYAKRYGLAAIIGLVTAEEVDDDGNAASGYGPKEDDDFQAFAEKKPEKKPKKKPQTMADVEVYGFRDTTGRAFVHANGKDTPIDMMNEKQLQFILDHEELGDLHEEAQDYMNSIKSIEAALDK